MTNGTRGGDEERPRARLRLRSLLSASASLTVFEEYAKLRAVDGNPFEITSETMRTLLDAAGREPPRRHLRAVGGVLRGDSTRGRRRRVATRNTRVRVPRQRRDGGADARDGGVQSAVETTARPDRRCDWLSRGATRSASNVTASMRDDLRLAMAEELAVKSRHMDPRTVVETLGVAADMGSNAPMTGATFAALKSSLARAGRDRGPHSPATLRAALDALARLTHPKNAALGRGDKVLTRRLASRLCGDVEETWDSIRSSSRASSNPGFEFADAVADLRRLAACANWGRPDGWFWTESVPAAAAIARAAETTTESATIEDAIDALGVLGKLRASFRNVAEGDGRERRPRRARGDPDGTRTPGSNPNTGAPRNSPTNFHQKSVASPTRCFAASSRRRAKARRHSAPRTDVTWRASSPPPPRSRVTTPPARRSRASRTSRRRRDARARDEVDSDDEVVDSDDEVGRIPTTKSVRIPTVRVRVRRARGMSKRDAWA